MDEHRIHAQGRVWAAQTPTDGVIGLGELKIRSVAHRQAEISYAVHTVLWSEGWSIRSAILAQASLSSRLAGIGVAMALPFIRRTRAGAWRSRQGARCLTFKVTPATRCWNLTTWQRERSSRWHQQVASSRTSSFETRSPNRHGRVPAAGGGKTTPRDTSIAALACRQHHAVKGRPAYDAVLKMLSGERER